MRALILLSALGSLGCAMLIALLPLTGTATMFTWEPRGSSSASTIPLTLTANTPKTMSVLLPCADVRRVTQAAAGEQVLFRTHLGALGLLLKADRTEAWIGKGSSVAEQGRLVGSEIGLDACSGSLELRYDNARAVASLSNGETQVEVPVERDTSYTGPISKAPFLVSGLSVLDALRDVVSVTLVTRPSTVLWPATRWLLAGLAAALALLTWILIRRTHPAPETAERWVHGPRWTLTDSLVGVSGVLGWVLVPPGFDEGWVINTLRQYPELGIFSQYYSTGAAAQSQGFWWEWIFRIWVQPADMPILFMRLPSLIIFVIAMWLLRRMLIERFLPRPGHRAARFMAALVMVVSAVAWVPTLRPEPIAALLLVLQFACVGRYARDANPRILWIIGTLAALGVAMHQTGLAVLGAGLACIPALYGWLRDGGRERWLVVAAAAACSLSALVTLLMLHTNAATWLAAAAEISGGGLHDSFLREGERLDKVLTDASVTPVRTLSAALVYASALLFLTRPGRRTGSIEVTVGWAALLSVGLMVLSASKWPWHFLALVPAAVVLMALGLERTDDRGGWKSVRWFSVGLASLCLGVFSLSNVRGWSAWDVTTISWKDINESLVSSPLTLGAVAVAAALLLHLLRARLGGLTMKRWALATSAGVAALIAAIALVPLVVDGIRRPETSWAFINLRSPVQPCGLTASQALAVPTATTPLNESLGQEPPEGVVRLAFRDLPTDTLPPVSDGFVYQPSPSATAVESPWFQLTAQEMTTWLLTAPTSEARYSVEWRTPQGVVSEPQTRVGGPGLWLRDFMSPPDGASEVRFRWRQGEGILALLGPVTVDGKAPLSEVSRDRVAFSRPNSQPYASCMSMPSIKGGEVTPFQWAIEVPQMDPNSFFPNYRWAQMACTNPEKGSNFCLYRMYPSPRVGLTQETISVPLPS